MNLQEDTNIIITDDSEGQAEDYLLYDVADRIFELRDELSVDIISKNIIYNFDNPTINKTINYVTKFKENYYKIKNDPKYENDINSLNNFFQEIAQLILTNLSVKFKITIGDDLGYGMSNNIDEYIDKIEALYEFFVVRRYSNIRDYFQLKLLKNKLDFVEKYKNVLDEKSTEDVFLNINKKKFSDPTEAIIIQFIDDIVYDIKNEISGAYDFYKDIVNLDLFEDFNNRINNMLINFGNELMILNDYESLQAYLKILDNQEIRINLENDLLTKLLDSASLNSR